MKVEHDQLAQPSIHGVDELAHLGVHPAPGGVPPSWDAPKQRVPAQRRGVGWHSELHLHRLAHSGGVVVVELGGPQEQRELEGVAEP